MDSAFQEGDSVVTMVVKQEEKKPLGGSSGGWRQPGEVDPYLCELWTHTAVIVARSFDL